MAYKYYKEIPGVVWIEKTFFCDETKVANIHWLEYLNSKGNSQHVNKSLDLINLGHYDAPQFYFFSLFDISYEDAIDFCKWRTEVVTSNYKTTHGIDKSSQNYTVFKFRLPTEAEWIKCASFAIDTLKFPNVFKDSLITMKINSASLNFLQFLGSNIDKSRVDSFNKEVKKDCVFNCKRTKNSFLNLKVPFYI